jgi:hypothetical protein
MKNSLKTMLVFCFLVFAAGFVAFLINKKPEFKDEGEEVLQAQDLEESVTIQAYIKMQQIEFKVYPEKRQPPTNNWQSHVDFKVRDETSGAIVFERNLVSTNSEGIGTIDLEHSENIPTDDYTVLIKGIAHLTKKYENIHFETIAEYYDFTINEEDLLAGDTHDSRDDYINSLDISTLINQLNTGDYVNDLNQDSIVNSLDLSNQVFNLSIYGDV